jgi:hypothetical protein
VNIQPTDTSRGHFYVSLVKSGLRIIASIYLMFTPLWPAGVFFAVAEVLGIVEEMV